MTDLLRNKGSGALLLTFFLLCFGFSAGAETASIAYAKLAGFRAAFDAMPIAQRDKLIFSLQILHTDPANHAQIHAWVDVDGKRTDIAVTAEGDAALPERPDWVARGVMLQTDQPRHSLNLAFGLLIRPPPGSTIPVDYLIDAARQAQQAIAAGAHQLAGMLAFFATPTVHAVAIRSATCCSETATLRAAGEMVLRQDKSGSFTLPIDMLQAYAGGTLTSSAPITKIEPSTD